MSVTTSSLFVRETGDPAGTPVVLLHSLFFDGSMFDALLGELGSGPRFLAPDHRGQGRSADGPLDLESLADDVAALIDERCGGTPAHVVGSSMGGYVVTHLAARRPDLVLTCALMGGTADAELDPAYFAGLEAALRDDVVSAVDRVEHTMFGDAHLALPLDAPVRARWRDHFAGLDARVADAAHAVFTRSALHAAFASVQAPILLVAGSSDHAKPPVHMERMADANPRARLVVLPGVGHTPAVEAPARVADLLLDHWSRAPASPAKGNT